MNGDNYKDTINIDHPAVLIILRIQQEKDTLPFPPDSSLPCQWYQGQPWGQPPAMPAVSTYSQSLPASLVWRRHTSNSVAFSSMRLRTYG